MFDLTSIAGEGSAGSPGGLTPTREAGPSSAFKICDKCGRDVTYVLSHNCPKQPKPETKEN